MPRDSRPLLAFVSLTVCALAPLWSGVAIAEPLALSHAHGILVPANGRVQAVSSPSPAIAVHRALKGGATTRTWHVTGSMRTGRYDSSATLLHGGQVLVAGGLSRGEPPLSTAEVYHPDTGRWSSTGGMNWQRSSHTSTLLPNGRVLVVGGYGGPSNGLVAPAALSSAEVYDPTTQRWQNVASMRTDRYLHTATALPDGAVLIAGGSYGKTRVLNTAELFDPTTHRWHSVGRMRAFRTQHTATLLPDGRVLVAGGTGRIDGTTVLGSAELFDPVTGLWHGTSPLLAARTNHTATLLLDGRVLVTGGITHSGKGTARAEIYNPATGRWSGAGTMRAARSNHTATRLPNGEVLVVGGANGPLASAELYIPAKGVWIGAGRLSIARQNHGAILLHASRVLVTGGYGGRGPGPLSAAETYG